MHQLPEWKHAGTVSSSTLRSEDLIPAFLDMLEQLDNDRANDIAQQEDALLYAMNAVEKSSRYVTPTDDYYQDLSELVVTLSDALDELAESPYYFGNLEGDGAEFGFWHQEYDPNSGDYISADGRKWYQYGKMVLDLNHAPCDHDGECGDCEDSECQLRDCDCQNADIQLRAHMEENQYWPDVWLESDHGNQTMMVLDMPAVATS